MIHDKKEFGIGVGLIAAFFVALVAIFMPLFEGGKNTLDYMDGMFNAISKHSAYYIPDVAKKAARHEGTTVTLAIEAADEAQATRMTTLFSATGATVIREGVALNVSTDIGRLMAAALADADLMYRNQGEAVAGKYGFEAKRALYDWHKAFAAMTKALNKQERFAEAKTLRDIQTKALEPAYNYFGVEAVPMSQTLWIALLALIGYVLYTIWYGFAILYIFEGWGLKLEH